MARIYWKVQQGSAAWFKLRAGIPTASEFDKIITPKKQELAAARFKYACKLIAERLLNWQADSLETIRHIEEGRQNEPFAVGQLHALAGIVSHKVGFVTTDDGRFGASPDRAVGGNPDLDLEEGSLAETIEVKCPTIPKQFEYLLLGHDDAYRCQVQGQLFVGEADKATFYSYSPRMPAYQIETGRDEPFIKKLADALEQFDDELAEMLERAQSLGIYQAFEDAPLPADREYVDNLRRDPLTTEAELSALIEQQMRPGEHHRAEA
jgi:YqaJ-like viral recombinase domain